jgi:hypothetical protein
LTFPESLENSKLIGHLTEDFTFSIEEFYQLKEIQKAFSSKEELIKTITKISFLKLDEQNKNCSILINEDLSIFSLINVPTKFSKDDLVKELEFEGKDFFSRVYKKYFVWILISDKNNQSSKIEESLKKVHFGDVK